ELLAHVHEALAEDVVRSVLVAGFGPRFVRQMAGAAVVELLRQEGPEILRERLFVGGAGVQGGGGPQQNGQRPPGAAGHGGGRGGVGWGPRYGSVCGMVLS